MRGYWCFKFLPKKNQIRHFQSQSTKDEVFKLRISSVNVTKYLQFPADLVTFTEETLMENFIFCAV